MTNWGRKMFVTPGVVVDGKLVTNDLVEINLGIRILLGHSFYRDWEDQEMFVTHDPLGNPVDRRHPWNQHTIPAPQKRDFDDKYSWTMSPRWFDGKDHLRAGHRRRPAGPAVGDRAGRAGGHREFVKATGHSVQINLPRTVLKPEVSFEWKPPVDKQGRPLSNAIERNRARTYFQAYSAGVRAALHREGAGRGARRATPRPGRSSPSRTRRSAVGFTEAVRGVLSHHMVIRGGKIANYHPYPPTPWNGSVRDSYGTPGPVRGRRAEHADLRGEPQGRVQGHRHHARGAQLRPVPAVRRAHVPRRREAAAQDALARRR